MLGLYRDLYRGFTVKHFHEHLAKRHNYTLGYTVTKLHLHRSGLVSPAKTRSAHRKKRPRRPMVGMMLHQDAASFPPLGDAGASCDAPSSSSPGHQPGPVQMYLGHRIAELVVVPFHQVLVEMLHREIAIVVAIKPQHPRDLRHPRPTPRRCNLRSDNPASPSSRNRSRQRRTNARSFPASPRLHLAQLDRSSGQAQLRTASDESPRECVPGPSKAPSLETLHRTLHELQTPDSGDVHTGPDLFRVAV